MVCRPGEKIGIGSRFREKSDCWAIAEARVMTHDASWCSGRVVLCHDSWPLHSPCGGIVKNIVTHDENPDGRYDTQLLNA